MPFTTSGLWGSGYLYAESGYVHFYIHLSYYYFGGSNGFHNNSLDIAGF